MTTDQQRVAVVTGAARGIGADVARRLAGDGMAVAVLDLDESTCADVVEDMTFVSTAGGAFLEWMEGKPLPGVEALKA